MVRFWKEHNLAKIEQPVLTNGLTTNKISFNSIIMSRGFDWNLNISVMCVYL